MPLPIAQIISAAAPLVMSAVELYRRRNEAKETGAAGGGGESLQARMRALEDADLEQSRLIAELSRSVEAMARTLEAAQTEKRRNEQTIRRLLGLAIALAVLSTGLTIWAIVR